MAMEPLLQAMRDNDSDVRRAAAQALGALGETALESLLWALRDNDSDVRQAAAQALGALGDPQALEPLLRALRDDDSDVRQAAAQALGALGDPQALKPLLRALRDDDSDVRQAAAQALEQLADKLLVRRLAHRAARALWWGLTDEGYVWRNVAKAAYAALRQVVARLTELEVAALPFADPLFPSPSRGKQWLRYGALAGGLVLLWLVNLIINIIANLLSEQLGTLVPRGGLVWLALVAAVGLGVSWLALVAAVGLGALWLSDYLSSPGTERKQVG